MISQKAGETPTTTINQLNGLSQQELAYLGLQQQGMLDGVPVNWMLRDINLRYSPAKYKKYIQELGR